MFTKRTITIPLIAVLAVTATLALAGCSQNSSDNQDNAGIEIRYCSD